ncbi:MAG: class I SAM-dependent methyltransferase [Sideroxydans sp.]|nr:class I SAM-dependent methyltransferase [Sideroxydans sp.]
MRSLLDRLPPAASALLLQGAAFASALLLVRLAPIHTSPLPFALLCGTFAAVFSRLAGLAKWWLLIQFLFAPALVLMLALELPPNFFLAAFLVLLAVYWSTFRTQVPLYLSSRKVWQAVETLLPAAVPGQAFSFIDLGSGLGGVLTHLARARPDGRFQGVETAPLPFLLSWLRTRLGGLRSNCQVQWGSLWNCDLAQYDVVFAYLSPVPMDKLWDKAKSEMRPGALFISNTFMVREQPPLYTYTLDDLHHSTLYIWRMNEPGKY